MKKKYIYIIFSVYIILSIIFNFYFFQKKKTSLLDEIAVLKNNILELEKENKKLSEEDNKYIDINEDELKKIKNEIKRQEELYNPEIYDNYNLLRKDLTPISTEQAKKIYQDNYLKRNTNFKFTNVEKTYLYLNVESRYNNRDAIGFLSSSKYKKDVYCLHYEDDSVHSFITAYIDIYTGELLGEKYESV